MAGAAIRSLAHAGGWDNPPMPDSIRIARPDDWHLHLRDGAALAAVLPHSARQFAAAIVMPNLRPPVVRVEQALAYRRRILEALPRERRSSR
jgi:dihydroorotase